MISIPIILETEQCRLRYPKVEDAAAIFSIVSSPEFPERLPLKEMSSRNAIETWLGRLVELCTEGRVYSWILEERDLGGMLGQATLSQIKGERKWALAFWIHPGHWGKGYASEATKRVLQFAFEVLGAKTVWAAAGTWNLGSKRVLEKVGMRYIGQNPQGYLSMGEAIPTSEYEITRATWQESQPGN